MGIELNSALVYRAICPLKSEQDAIVLLELLAFQTIGGLVVTFFAFKSFIGIVIGAAVVAATLGVGGGAVSAAAATAPLDTNSASISGSLT